MKDVTPRRPRHRSPLLMGLALILIGALMLLVNLGFSLPPAVRSYWPLGLIVLGVVGIVAPTRHLSRSSSIWILAAGLYYQISLLHLFDLSWSTAWPIFIIAAGLGVIADPKEACFPDKLGDDPGERRQGAS